jgi:hypothetical protein
MNGLRISMYGTLVAPRPGHKLAGPPKLTRLGDNCDIEFDRRCFQVLE